MDRDLSLLVYAGHGTEKSFVGEDLVFHMFRTGDVRPAIKNKIIVAIPACFTAKELGPKCIEMGARTFIGATDSMFAAFDNEHHRFFSEDWIGHHMAFYEVLFRGGTVGEALSAYKERGHYYVRMYRTQLAWVPDADWHTMAFNQNVEVITLLGDPSARIEQGGGSFELPDLRTLLMGFFLPLGMGIAVPLVADAVRRAIKRD